MPLLHPGGPQLLTANAAIDYCQLRITGGYANPFFRALCKWHISTPIRRIIRGSECGDRRPTWQWYPEQLGELGYGNELPERHLLEFGHGDGHPRGCASSSQVSRAEKELGNVSVTRCLEEYIKKKAQPVYDCQNDNRITGHAINIIVLTRPPKRSALERITNWPTAPASKAKRTLQSGLLSLVS